MTIWFKSVVEQLEACWLFTQVGLIGAKVRAAVDESRFLDIYFDPTRRSYSYAFSDRALDYPGDKRVFGWDDYPHEGVPEITRLGTHPHHLQKRAEDGTWLFEASPMRGDVEHEIAMVIAATKAYLQETSPT